MDDLVQYLARRRNAFIGLGIATLALFIVLLFFSDAGAAAQALGSLIGAAIGALGAGAAVYWQIDRKRMEDAALLSEVRRSAFRSLTTELIIKVADIAESVDQLIAHDISGAAASIERGAVGAFGVDPRFAERLNVSAPRDAETLDRLRAVNGSLWELAKRIVRGTMPALPEEMVTRSLASSMIVFCEVAIEFVSERREAIEASESIIHEANSCIERLESAGLAPPSEDRKHRAYVWTR